MVDVAMQMHASQVHLENCAAIAEILTECEVIHEDTLRRAVESAVGKPGFDQALRALIRAKLIVREYGMISESGVGRG